MKFEIPKRAIAHPHTKRIVFQNKAPRPIPTHFIIGTTVKFPVD